jgi:hypothetical protein
MEECKKVNIQCEHCQKGFGIKQYESHGCKGRLLEEINYLKKLNYRIQNEQ